MADHHNASDKQMQLAQQKNITLPDSMSQKYMDQVQNLRNYSKQEFDRQYIDMMVSSHEEAISMFEDASNKL